jgi:hypothetical protein
MEGITFRDCRRAAGPDHRILTRGGFLARHHDRPRPGRKSGVRRTVGSLRIANRSDLADISDYCVEALKAANPLTGSPPGIASCEVIGHNRRQSIWTLLAKAARRREGGIRQL